MTHPAGRESESAPIQRAVECVDHLEAVETAFNGKAFGVDVPTEGTDGVEQVPGDRIPVEITKAAELAVSAILSALEALRRPINTRDAGDPPEWWRDIRRATTDHGMENSHTHASFTHALGVLNRHIDDKDYRLASLAFLAGDLNRKIIYVPALKASGPSTEPNPNQGVYAFDLQINAEVYHSFLELSGKAFPALERCGDFLRGILDDITDRWQHNITTQLGNA